MQHTHQNIEIIGIGGETSLFNTMRIATGLESFSKENVWGAIQNLAGKTDEELSHFPHNWEVLPELVFVYAIMDHLGIEQMEYKFVRGNTIGILMAPEFWAKPPSIQNCK